MTSKNTICLWYDTTPRRRRSFMRRRFRTSLSPRCTRAGRLSRGKQGEVLTVEFTVLGIPCLGLNGGPAFKHNEAFSFQVAHRRPSRNGSLLERDRRQRRPGEPVRLVQGPMGPVLADHTERADRGDAPMVAKQRAFDAMMTMKKIDVAAIEAARRG